MFIFFTMYKSHKNLKIYSSYTKLYKYVLEVFAGQKKSMKKVEFTLVKIILIENVWYFTGKYSYKIISVLQLLYFLTIASKLYNSK